MLSSKPHYLLLTTLLLTQLAAAIRYRFAIQEVQVTQVRDRSQDNLTLGIAATAGISSANGTWSLGTAKAGMDIKNATTYLDINVTDSTANLSVAYAIVDQHGQGDAGAQLIEGLVTALGTATGGMGLAISSLVDTILGFFSSLFDCDGLVATLNLVYTPAMLDGYELHTPYCNTEVGQVFITSDLCGRNPNYTVTYCVTRLDPKPANGTAGARSGAVGSASLGSGGFGLAVGLAGVAVGFALLG